MFSDYLSENYYQFWGCRKTSSFLGPQENKTKLNCIYFLAKLNRDVDCICQIQCFAPDKHAGIPGDWPVGRKNKKPYSCDANVRKEYPHDFSLTFEEESFNLILEQRF